MQKPTETIKQICGCGCHGIDVGLSQTMCHCQKPNQYTANVRFKLNSSPAEIEKKINIAREYTSTSFEPSIPHNDAGKEAKHLATHTHAHVHNYVVLFSSKYSNTHALALCTIKRARSCFSLSRTPVVLQSALPPPLCGPNPGPSSRTTIETISSVSRL